MEFLLLFIAMIGLTHIMVDSSFMDPFRTWARGGKDSQGNTVEPHFPEKVLWFHPREMIDCYQCMGTWCGWALGFIFSFFLLNTGWLACLTTTFFCGFAGSFLANLGADVLTWLQANSMIDIDEPQTQKV